MKSAWLLTIAAVAVSLLAVPVGLWSYFALYGPPIDSGFEMILMSLIVMLPGPLMGATALWVAAWG